MLNSLHIRILAWLVIPLLFISITHLATSYVDKQNTSQEIFDKLLVTLALSISEHALSSSGDLLTDDILELIRVTTNDNLYYKVIGPDEAFITGYEDIPEPPEGIQFLESNLQFYDSVYLEQPVRVIAVSMLVDTEDYHGWMTTFVAQTLRDRDLYVKSFLVDDIYRVILMIIISTILLSVGISLGLKPLKKLQASINRRDSHDLSPIKKDNLPQEIDGLVDELNSLLYRVTDHLTLTKRFIENAAHQLRTPVTALLPQTELALRAAESDREKATIEKIKTSADKVARLTHQLLNLTYAESIALTKKDFLLFDLAKTVTTSIESIRMINSELKLNIDLSYSPMLGISMLLDEVVKNLIDNAIKYGDSSAPIEVNCCVIKNKIFLDIINQGSGIAFEFREKVTERFFRLADENNGSGLGLSIVKEIVSTHNGTLEILDASPANRLSVTNSSNSGTCVRCTFDLFREE